MNDLNGFVMNMGRVVSYAFLLCFGRIPKQISKGLGSSFHDFQATTWSRGSRVRNINLVNPCVGLYIRSNPEDAGRCAFDFRVVQMT